VAFSAWQRSRARSRPATRSGSNGSYISPASIFSRSVMISNARVSPASLEPHDLPDHAVALRQDVEIAIAGLRETYIHPAFSGDAAGTGQRFTLPSTRGECLFHQAAKAGVP